MELLDQVFQIGVLVAAIRMATPLLLGTLGAMMAERSGVVNLGIDGVMTAGAFLAFAIAVITGSLWLGLAAAIVGGAVVGLATGVLVIDLQLDQTVTGIGVMLTLYGLVYFVFRLQFGGLGTPPAIDQFRPLPIPILSDLPLVGPVLFSQNLLTYLAFLLVPLISVLLFSTPWGLVLRTVGENPQAAAAAGLSVRRIRYIALATSSALAAAGGAFLTLAVFNSFTFGIVSGRGWICLALVVLGRWSPWGCAGAVLLFGLIDALQLRLQTSGAIAVPFQVFLMLPFLVTLGAMILAARRVHAPAALMKPYSSEDR